MVGDVRIAGERVNCKFITGCFAARLVAIGWKTSLLSVPFVTADYTTGDNSNRP